MLSEEKHAKGSKTKASQFRDAIEIGLVVKAE